MWPWRLAESGSAGSSGGGVQRGAQELLLLLPTRHEVRAELCALLAGGSAAAGADATAVAAAAAAAGVEGDVDSAAGVEGVEGRIDIDPGLAASAAAAAAAAVETAAAAAAAAADPAGATAGARARLRRLLSQSPARLVYTLQVLDGLLNPVNGDDNDGAVSLLRASFAALGCARDILAVLPRCAAAADTGSGGSAAAAGAAGEGLVIDVDSIDVEVMPSKQCTPRHVSSHLQLHCQPSFV